MNHCFSVFFWLSLTGYLTTVCLMAAAGPIGKNLFLFGPLYLLCFGLMMALIRFFPDTWSRRRQLLLIWAVAVFARLTFLFFPVSDDVNRYIWEGFLLNQGINPYLSAPDAPELSAFRDLLSDIWPKINHKDASACYPPLAMLVFRLSAFISPTTCFFNGVMILFDLAALAMIVLVLKAYSKPLKQVLLYALNPLVLVFIAGEGHLDAIQVFFVWLGFYLLLRKKDCPGFVSLACAVMSKYFALIFVPMWFKADKWRSILVFCSILLLLYLPFWSTGLRLFSSLIPFGVDMHYNDSVTVILREIVGFRPTLISMIIFSGFFAAIFLLVHDPLKSGYWAAGVFLLLVSTLHPWYLTLITPFLVFFPSRAWLYLHVGVLCMFPVLHNQFLYGGFKEIYWLKWFEYLPFYCLLLWDAYYNTPYFSDRCFESIHRVSIVIPTFNEAQHIGDCLDALQKETHVTEIIVSDGGSQDTTCEIAAGYNAKVIASQIGRGYQIRKGVMAATGDLIMILHADCVLDRQTLKRVMAKLNRQPQIIGGAVGMRFSDRSWQACLIEGMNNLRARGFGIAFGDQAQFFRKQAVSLMGGIPDQMLMEDIELSLRLKEQGTVCFLPHGVTASSRRWHQKGFKSNFLLVVGNSLSYLVQRRLGLGDRKRRAFNDRYYVASIR
jgi:rSAM/selenodomain-associated transferase 2